MIKPGEALLVESCQADPRSKQKSEGGHIDGSLSRMTLASDEDNDTGQVQLRINTVTNASVVCVSCSHRNCGPSVCSWKRPRNHVAHGDDEMRAISRVCVSKQTTATSPSWNEESLARLRLRTQGKSHTEVRTRTKSVTESVLCLTVRVGDRPLPLKQGSLQRNSLTELSIVVARSHQRNVSGPPEPLALVSASGRISVVTQP